MQFLLPSLIIIFDLALPTALIFWLWKSKAKSRLYYLSVLLFTVTYLIAVKLSIFGFWYVIGGFWPYLFLLAAAAVVLVPLMDRPPTEWFPSSTKELIGAAFNVVVASLWVFVTISVLNAGRMDEAAVHLTSPLRDGSFMVIGGGGNLSVNQHTRSVRYAIDITRLNTWGRRSSSLALFPDELEEYEIFGAEIVAPCAGEVIGVENDVADQPPLHPDFSGLSNYVAVYCEGHTIRLLHMKQGSVKVALGERVTTGQPLGSVGNSGNTAEPHLHIDAIAGRLLLDNRNDQGVKSVPIKLDGRFLIKGDTVSSH